MEVWVGIDGFNYSVSNKGRVRNDRTGRVLKPQCFSRGYRAVSLRKDGENHMRYVHLLVAEAFLRRYTDNLVVDHIDGNPANNDLRNLRFVSQSYNVGRVRGREVEAWKDGVCVATYPCVRCAPKEFHPSSICRTIRTGKPYKGYLWKYKN